MRVLKECFRRARFFLFILAGTGFASSLWADDIQWKKTPIQTRWSFWDGMEYSLNGEKLSGTSSLEDAIFPLNDPESTRLLKNSETTGWIGGIGWTLGTLTAGWGAGNLLFNDSPSTNSTHVAFLLTGLGVDLIASLWGLDSQSSKYNAVERYNRVVRGEDQPLPQAPVDEKSLLPVLNNKK